MYNGVTMRYTFILPRGAAKLACLNTNLSKDAKLRLKWFDYHRKCRNISQTCRYFGISRKTFHKWQKIYNPKRLESLESRDRAPKRRRKRQITPEQELRIIALRKQYIRYGKEKLAVIYKNIYREKISSWKIQEVIERKNLYYHPAKNARIAQKRKCALKRKRITELKKKRVSGFLLCLDTVVIYWNGLKRYIFTAIDKHSKIAFSRMYSSKSSRNAKDFLLRLDFLLNGKIQNIQRDNGSEFLGEFERTLAQLKIGSYFSRVKTPDDNPNNKRFNRTLQEEFIQLGNFTPDLVEFNRRLTNWLIEYNFHRPHEALNYETPINFNNSIQVLPMYPSRTIICAF